MPTLCEYTTVKKLHDYKDFQSSASDVLMLDMIRQASGEIEEICNRRFFPRILTHSFDTPRQSMDLLFDDDLLEVTTLTNGDGQVIPSSDYKLYDLNFTPKRKLTLLPIRYMWQMDNFGTPYGAISLAGVWGYHEDYANAWIDTGATLAAAITTAGQATVTVTTGKLTAGDLLKIDGEYIYASAVALGASDTLSMTRGVNGSTAATHLISAPILRWDAGTKIAQLCVRAACAYTKLRANPISETVNVDGITYVTPKDVLKWMDSALRGLGLIRPGIG